MLSTIKLGVIKMNKLTKILYKWQLPRLTAMLCKFSIPRSGDEGNRVNCYVVALDNVSDPYFLATAFNNNKLIGLEWDGKSYTNKKSISIDSISKSKVRITHYYGLSEVTYSGIYDLLINKITKWPYIKIHASRLISSVDQYFFNKKKLVTKQRIDLLKFMMLDQIDRINKGISSLDLMTKLYSIKWVLHPEGDQQKEELKLYLDSLVKSEDLENPNDEYVVTGNAIRTIEKFEEEERRHVESVKMQRRMLFLTFIIVILAIIQAEVIKLPVLLDLSGK